MDETKPWWQSRTIWGSIAVLLVLVIKLIKPDAEVTDTELLDVIMATVGIVGSIMAIWGRIVAQKRLTRG